MTTYLYHVQMDIPEEYEAEFNRVYDEEHIPLLMKLPGVIACRRYRLEHSSVAGVARYLAVYELESPDVVKRPEWQAASDTGDWKPNIRPHTTNRLHCMYQRIF